MLRVMCSVRMGHYIVIPTSHVFVFKFGVGVCFVPTTDAVKTGNVNCYNCLVGLCSLPRFEMISQGHVVECNTPGLRGCHPGMLSLLPVCWSF